MKEELFDVGLGEFSINLWVTEQTKEAEHCRASKLRKNDTTAFISGFRAIPVDFIGHLLVFHLA